MRFEFLAGSVALDFANTVHNHGADDPQDDLQTVDDLAEWAVQAGLVRSAESVRLRKQPKRANALRRARDLREFLYAIFSRVARGKGVDAELVDAFQAIYHRAVQHTEFQRTGQHYRLAWPSRMDLLDRVLFDIIRSAADLLTSDALSRVRQCSGETCTWLFLDTSRNGLRRWCDMKRCGNRAKVRRFRLRQLRPKGPSGRM